MTNELTTIIDLTLTMRDSMETQSEADKIGQNLPLLNIIIEGLTAMRDGIEQDRANQEIRRTRKRVARLTTPSVEVPPQPFKLALVPALPPIPA